MNTTSHPNALSNAPAAKSPAPVAPAGPRPLAPFALSLRFDRARGAFVVQAGARAGAAAFVTIMVLGLGTAAFVRNVFSGPATASAADVTSAPEPADEVVPPAVAAQPRSFSEYVRTPGLNYLIIKSFPNKKAADKARLALIRKGVATTVERSLPGWSGKGWYSLVGMTGFELDREQNLFDVHVRDLKKLKLDPKPYKWRGSDAAAQPK